MDKIELVIVRDGYGSDYSHTVMHNGKEVGMSRDLSECPEDAILGRDLFTGREMISLIKLGYALGKAGVEVEYTTRIKKEDEEDEE